MNLGQYWQKVCTNRFGFSTTTSDLRRINELAEEHGENRARYGIREYARQMPSPSVRDFESWLAAQELPDEVVCAAYLTEDPEIVKMAEKLETLRGAWFPTPDIADDIYELEKRLRGLLV
jgi:hypothetical protein